MRLFLTSPLAFGPLLSISGILGVQSITLISAFTFTWCSPGMTGCLQISPFYKDTSHIGREPTLINFFSLESLCRDPISKSSHILRNQKLGFQQGILVGVTVQHDTQTPGCHSWQLPPLPLCVQSITFSQLHLKHTLGLALSLYPYPYTAVLSLGLWW